MGNKNSTRKKKVLYTKQPERWQDFLCQHELETCSDDRVSNINTNVSPEKMKIFLLEFADPDNNENACVSELLFVIELIEIKHHILRVINARNASSINQCGLIVEIPNGLPSSNLITESQHGLNIDDIYDIMARLYLKYINYDTASIPIYGSIETEKLDAVYDKLTHEFPQSMCLKWPMTPEEIKVDNVLIAGEKGNDTPCDMMTDIVINTNKESESRITSLDESELQNIYKLITIYDEILCDAAIKIQSCYDKFIAKMFKTNCKNNKNA